MDLNKSEFHGGNMAPNDFYRIKIYPWQLASDLLVFASRFVVLTLISVDDKPGINLHTATKIYIQKESDHCSDVSPKIWYDSSLVQK